MAGIDSFVPEIWAANILTKLQKSLVFGAAANHDYEGEISEYGDTVHINSVNDVTIGDYVAHKDITVEALGTEDQTLVINRAKYFAFEVDDIEKRQGRSDLIGPTTARTAYLISDVIDQYLADLFSNGVVAENKLGDVDASTDPSNVYDAIVSLRVQLDKSLVPTDGRFLIVAPDVYGLLLKDTRFIVSSEAANATLHNGIVGDIAGFSVRVSNNAPQPTTGTPAAPVPNVYRAIAGSTIAVTFADSINKVEAFRKPYGFADVVKGLCLHGGKVVRPEALASVDIKVK